MLQAGLIEERAHGELKVLKRDFTYESLDPEIVNQMSVSLHDHATTLAHNLNEERKSPPRFEGIADNIHISSRSARSFMNLVETRGMDFLNEMDGWLSTHETEESKSAAGREVLASALVRVDRLDQACEVLEEQPESPRKPISLLFWLALGVGLTAATAFAVLLLT